VIVQPSKITFPRYCCEQICELKVECYKWFQPKSVSLPCKGTIIAVEIADGCLNFFLQSLHSHEFILYVQLLHKPCSCFFFLWNLMKHPTTQKSINLSNQMFLLHILSSSRQRVSCLVQVRSEWRSVLHLVHTLC